MSNQVIILGTAMLDACCFLLLKLSRKEKKWAREMSQFMFLEASIVQDQIPDPLPSAFGRK